MGEGENGRREGKKFSTPTLPVSPSGFEMPIVPDFEPIEQPASTGQQQSLFDRRIGGGLRIRNVANQPPRHAFAWERNPLNREYELDRLTAGTRSWAGGIELVHNDAAIVSRLKVD